MLINKFTHFIIAVFCFLIISGQNKKEISFIAITDTHIHNVEELNDFRDFLYSTSIKYKPDFILILGDICGHAPEYLPRIKNIIDNADVKVHVLPGNHDDYYGKMLSWYEPVFGRSNYFFTAKGWKFIMASSQIDSRTFINTTLSSFKKNDKIVFCQHYPVSDTKTIGNAATDKRIKIFLNGHIHSYKEYDVNNVKAYTLNNCFFRNSDGASEYYLLHSNKDNITVESRYLSELEILKKSDNVPSIEFTNINDGIKLSDTFIIEGQCFDDQNVSFIDIRLNNNKWTRLKVNRNFKYKLDTKKYRDGHYLLEARAIDNKGQESVKYASVICFIKNNSDPDNTRTFQNGVNGYNEYSDSSTTLDGRIPEDLECSVWERGELEYNQFSMKFDLPKNTPLNFKEAFIIIQCSRENFQSLKYPNDSADYTISIPDTKIVSKRAWPMVSHSQDIVPPISVTICITEFKNTIIDWIKDSSKNNGLDFKPMIPVNYNFSAISGRNKIISLRPKLVLIY